MKKTRQTIMATLKSKQLSRKTLVISFGLIGLCLLAVLGGLIGYNLLRSNAIKDRPLVLIRTPDNHDRVAVGMEVSVHATARSRNGIARIELWADDALVSEQDAPEDEILSPAVLHAYWAPAATGPHTLVVQAVSMSGVRSQATVVLYADESMVAETGAESETESAGGSAAESPEGGAGTGGGEASPGPAPGAGGSPPGSGDDVRDLLDDDPTEPETEPSAEGGEPTALKVEILALETVQSYEGLHCYVSFGESDDAPSQWYPDFDGDQATDDSFPSSDGRNWDVEPYLAGDALPTIIWPEDQPLGINSTCVGIADGGMAAPELGEINLIRRPDTWDSITRHAVSEGGEGTYSIDYRISKEDGTSEDPVAKVIDPTMASPTNLHIQNWTNPFGEIVGQSLMWDYEPNEDELPIDGFIIYLNETLQWTVPADRHFSDVPSQWFRPPCGETYELTVSSYRVHPVTGFESPPAEALSFYTADVGDPVCIQTYLFSFNTMTTGTLLQGRLYDGMFGSFYVNDESVDFDGRCRGSGICGEVGLYENYEYDLHSTTSFLGNGPTQFLITQGDDLTLHFGFEVHSTYTTGLGETSTTNFCHNDGSIGWLELEAMANPLHEDRMSSDGPESDFCQVYYTIEPLGEGPSVRPGQPPPLPLLAVEEIHVDDTGWLQIQIRNEGNADWTHSIPFSLTKNSGEPIGTYTWPSSTIAPGGRLTLEYDTSDEFQPMDVCVTLDPENVAPEQDDRFERPREPYCHPLPDLSILRVSYDPLLETLALLVDNPGGPQEHTDLVIQLDVPGITLRPRLHPDVTLGRTVTRIEMLGFNEEIREAMMAGYTITLDPDNDIAETHEDNNVHTVSPGATLRLHWYRIITHYYPYRRLSTSPQDQSFRLTVTTGSREASSSTGHYALTTVADWSTGSFEIDYDVDTPISEGRLLYEQQYNMHEWAEFTIAGDEYLYLSISGAMKYRANDWRSLGRATRSYAPDHWGVGRSISEDQDCWYVGIGPPHTDNERDIVVQPPWPWQSIGNWRSTVLICRVE